MWPNPFCHSRVTVKYIMYAPSCGWSLKSWSGCSQVSTRNLMPVSFWTTSQSKFQLSRSWWKDCVVRSSGKGGVFRLTCAAFLPTIIDPGWGVRIWSVCLAIVICWFQLKMWKNSDANIISILPVSSATTSELLSSRFDAKNWDFRLERSWNRSNPRLMKSRRRSTPYRFSEGPPWYA